MSPSLWKIFDFRLDNLDDIFEIASVTFDILFRNGVSFVVVRLIFAPISMIGLLQF